MTDTMNRQNWIRSLVLVLFIALLGIGLAAWKYESLQSEHAASASQPEPSESITVTVARTIDHRPNSTSIGTVLALRSISLKNELAGTVREVRLRPGQLVEAGALLVALDVSVEEADMPAQEAQVALAKTSLNRRQHLSQELATTQEEVDRARADLDVAQAQIARTKAVIAKKTIRAPFRARVGIADVHPGQYLDEGTLLTTLQGVSEAVNVDFAVPQQVAGSLQVGETVEVVAAGAALPIKAKIIALDARVDPDISVTIKDIQQSARAASETMQGALKDADAGTSLGVQGERAVNEIRQATAAVHSVFQDIAAGIAEQSYAGQSLASNVEVVAQAADASSAVVTRAASAAQTLEPLAGSTPQPGQPVPGIGRPLARMPFLFAHMCRESVISCVFEGA